MKSKTKIIYLLMLGSITFFATCKKDDDKTNNNNTTANGKLLFHLHTNIADTEAEYGDKAANADGRMMTLSLAQLYISGVKLIKTDGSSININNAYLLVKTGEEQYLVGDAPAGNYTTVSFNVGIDADANKIDPSTQPASSVLSPQNPSMWFGATDKGYIFVNVAGTIDTSANKNGVANYPFSYKIGSDALLKTVTMPTKSFTISPDQAQEVHLVADYSMLLNGLNLKTENMNATYYNQNLAAKVAGNIPQMFRYE